MYKYIFHSQISIIVIFTLLVLITRRASGPSWRTCCFLELGLPPLASNFKITVNFIDIDCNYYILNFVNRDLNIRENNSINLMVSNLILVEGIIAYQLMLFCLGGFVAFILLDLVSMEVCPVPSWLLALNTYLHRLFLLLQE